MHVATILVVEELNDVLDIIKKYGAMPEEAYPGLNYGTDKHVHGELDKVLKHTLMLLFQIQTEDYQLLGKPDITQSLTHT